MKNLFKILKLLIGMFFIAIIALLLTNKTFIYEVYKNNKMSGEGIPLKRFNYFLKDQNNVISLITPLSKNYLDKEKNSYLDGLEKCYGIYYYDKENDITITGYDIEDKDYYRNIKIKYQTDNYCSSDYVLSDMWVYEYIALTHFEDGDITEKAMAGLIDKAYMSKRIEDPTITDYKSRISINVNCVIDEAKYTLVFEDFNENELLVKKVQDGKTQIAVYEVENVKEYLDTLEKAKK